MDKVTLDLNVKSANVSSYKNSEQVSVVAESGQISVSLYVRDISDIPKIRELGGAYPTEGVTYCFSFEPLENGMPLKIISFMINQHDELEYVVQFKEGDDFIVRTPIAALDNEFRSHLKIGETIYASLKFN